MTSPFPPKNEGKVPWTNKQVRNRYSSAGITEREADTIKRCMKKLRKISRKKNLYVGHQRRLLESVAHLQELLEKTDRL